MRPAALRRRLNRRAPIVSAIGDLPLPALTPPPKSFACAAEQDDPKARYGLVPDKTKTISSNNGSIQVEAIQWPLFFERQQRGSILQRHNEGWVVSWPTSNHRDLCAARRICWSLRDRYLHQKK